MCSFAVTTKVQKKVSKQQLSVLALTWEFPWLPRSPTFSFSFSFISLPAYYIFSMVYFP